MKIVAIESIQDKGINLHFHIVQLINIKRHRFHPDSGDWLEPD